MPVIRIDFDGKKVSHREVELLCEAVQRIVAETTHIEDTFVYANSPQISYKIAPIEIFIQLSDHKITDLDALVATLKARMTEWKQQSNFSWPINFSFIPMNWKIEIGI
jgi:hypothetical protein